MPTVNVHHALSLLRPRIRLSCVRLSFEKRTFPFNSPRDTVCCCVAIRDEAFASSSSLVDALV
jgi:hypothetical protein